MFRLIASTLGLLACVQSYAQFVAPGCTQRYPLDGNLNAALGTPNGTSTGTLAFEPGVYGQSAIFNGTTKVDLGNIGAFGTGDFSVSFWMKFVATPSMAILGRRAVCNYASFWNVRSGIGNGLVGIEIDQSSVSNQSVANSITKVGDGLWHHVVVRRSSTSLSIYVDGAIESTRTTPILTNVSANSATVKAGTGACDNISSTLYNGNLDDIQFYSRSLSLLEMRQIGAAGGITPITVSGTVDLSPSPTIAGMPVTITLSRNGTTFESYNTTLNASGGYSVQTTLRGPFRVSAKVLHWLSAGSPRTLTDAGVSDLTHPLINGDVDGDNEISILDYIELSSKYETLVADPLQMPQPDLDGDGEVSILDYLIVSANYEMVGD